MRRSTRHVLGAGALALATLAAGAAPAASTPARASRLTAPPPAPRALQPLGRVRNLDLTLSGVFISTGTVEAFSTPAAGDLDGDHSPDIVTATLDGTVAAYRASGGALLWKTNVGRTAIHASPLIADVVNDARPEVVIATMDGRVLLLNGQNGRVGQTFRQGAPLYCPAGVDCRPDGFFATPAVGDVDGDGKLDLVAASWDHTVYAWRIDGRLLFRRYLYDTLWSSPVIADVDRNGSNEIILGGDIHAGNTIAKPAGGLLWVLRRDGTTYPGYPYSTPGQTVWSSPAVADLDGDGLLDAVFGSGVNFADPAGRRAHAITLKTGRNLAGWPVAVNGRVMNSPAIGDLDGNGSLEVTFAAEGDYVYAYNANGTRRWAACNSWSGQPCTPGRWPSHGGTVIADVDGDGAAEVISTLEASTRIFDGRTGRLEAEFGLGSGNAILAPPASPTVIAVDGKAVIVQQTIVKAGGHAGGARAGDVSRLHLLTTGQPLGAAPWPTFHGQADRSGRPARPKRTWAR